MYFPIRCLRASSLLPVAAFRPFWLAMAILLIFSGCKQNNEALPGSEPTTPLAVTICHGGITNILPHIALAQDYFAEEGLKVTFKEMDGKNAFDGMLKGECNFAVSGTPPIAMADHASNPFTILATILADDDVTKIIARRDQGINSPSDLKGKRIATKKGTHGHIFLDKFLNAHGLKTKEITLIDLEMADMQDALLKGEIDGFSMISKSVNETAEKLGDKAVIFSAPGINIARAILTTRTDMPLNLQATPGILKALIKAQQYAKNDPASAKALLVKKQAATKQEINAIWKRSTIEVALANSLLLCLEEQFRWQTAQNNAKIPENMPNYLDFISPEYLNAIKPGATSVLIR